MVIIYIYIHISCLSMEQKMYLYRNIYMINLNRRLYINSKASVPNRYITKMLSPHSITFLYCTSFHHFYGCVTYDKSNHSHMVPFINFLGPFTCFHTSQGPMHPKLDNNMQHQFNLLLPSFASFVLIIEDVLFFPFPQK